MKLFVLVDLCIVLSTLQAVLVSGDDVLIEDHSNHADPSLGLATSNRLMRGGANRGRSKKESQEHDETHRQTKKAAGAKSAPKKNPCSDLNSFVAEYMKISTACIDTSAAIDNGWDALLAQYTQYCRYLDLPQTPPTDGVFKQDMIQLVNTFCAPLMEQATRATYAWNEIVNKESSMDALYNQMSGLYNHAANLINQCLPTGIIPAGSEMSTPPSDCFNAPPPADYYTGCPPVFVGPRA